MDKLRLVYRQTGRAVWCSHLDTMRTLQRGLNRAGVPIRYSEGFNPHAQISIVMPLSVGQESLCQLADIRVREDIDITSLPDRLTECMPEGFVFTNCYEDGKKPAELKWLQVSGRWEFDRLDSSKAAEAAEKLFAGDVIVQRKTKRGEGPFAISEHIRNLRFTPGDGAVLIHATLSCNEPVVNPDLLTAALRQNLPEFTPDFSRFCREKLFTIDFQEFE